MEEAPREEVMGVSKGKRTKRARLQSLIPFMTINAHSSTGDADVNGTVFGEVSIFNNNDDNNNNSSPPLVTSDENFPDEDVPTKEEKETAKCLLLLSQGGRHHHHRQTTPSKVFDLFNNDMGLYQTKFNSKRYVETTDLGNGAKAGTYMYQCKTCNRTFPSFQALGGHRASHKKPKLLTIEPKKQLFFYFSDQDEPSPPPPTTTTNYKYNNKLSPILSPLSTQINNINMESPNYNKSPSPRIHTCSYCGAEFTSGQALGGHMRRHRRGANTNNTILCLSPLSIDQESTNYNLKIPRNGLSLDLNLPAPQEYQNQSRNLQQYPQKYAQEQAQKQQEEQEQEQTALVLSTTPQLIGCHF